MGERKLCYGCMQFKPETDKICHKCGYAEGTPSDPNFITPGTILNERYAVGVKIGHNSEGATYIGYNKSIGCKVLIREYMPQGLCVRVKGKATISVNPSHVVQYKALMAEFTELNKSLAQMRSLAHINPTLDLFATNNTTYAVYEYLEGIKLVDYLKDNAGELTWKQVSEMFPPFFTTLSLLHNNGVIHRGISPDTIYVTPKGELRLCGFAISTVRTAHTELPCEIFHGYAAPEQYAPSSRQGTWTDVYGICAVLYRILTGCKPTDATGRLENDNLCEPHEMNPGIPRHVSKVIMRGMNLFGSDRIQTVTELVTQLFEQVPEPEPKPIPAEPAYRPRQQVRQQPVRPTPPPVYDDDDYDDYDDYDVEDRDSMIDRIKIPIIIGVLLMCVLLVIAMLALKMLELGPFANTTSTPVETRPPVTDHTPDNIVTEPQVQDTTGATVQSGDSNMPDIVGKDFETKKRQFEAEGWIFLEATYDYSDKYKKGQVTWQSIEPGTSFNSGVTMQVIVSKGPAKVKIPEYEGKTLKEYEKELDALGLRDSYVTEAVTNYKFESGEVIELNVEAGDMFDLTGDDTLKIYYASNPETTTAETTTAVETTTTEQKTTTTAAPTTETKAPAVETTTAAPVQQTEPPAQTEAPPAENPENAE